MKTLRILAVLATICVPAFAQSNQHLLDSTGNDFLEYCGVADKESSSMSAFDSARLSDCTYYIAGLLQGILMENVRLRAAEKRAIPANFDDDTVSSLPRIQTVRVLLKYIKDHPEQANIPTCFLFSNAVRKSFPVPHK